METQITTNELARMVADGFTHMDERFLGIDGRMDGLEQRIETLTEEVRGTNTRVDTLVSIVDDHSRRIKKLEVAAA